MKKRAALVLFIFSFIAVALSVADFLHPGLPATHDGQDHVARIANFSQSLSEGHLIPRWAGNLNWGYGHPILMFLYPLPSYLASAAHAFGFSFVDSTKLVFAGVQIVSFLTMFLWVRAWLGVYPGIAAGVLYAFAPYRFVDLYVRGAIGEHMAFVFLPLVCYGLMKTATSPGPRTMIVSVVSFALLILSHNAISLAFLPVAFLYGVYLYLHETRDKRRFVRSGLLSALLAFGVAAFFWIPAFFEGKYTLRDIVTNGVFEGRFVPFTDFLISGWSYGGSAEFTKEIGIVHWVVMIISLMLAFRTKNIRTKHLVGGILFGTALTVFFMMRPSAVFWNSLSILQKFQFPWRLLTLTTFFSALLGGIAVTHIPVKGRWLTVAVIIVTQIILTNHMWRATRYVVRPAGFYTESYPGTTDTGESSPIWSVRFMERYPGGPLQVIRGKAAIEEVKRMSNDHEYRLFAEEPSRLLENTLYFPGWTVYLDSVPLETEFQDPAFRGLMTFEVPQGMHSLSVRFSDTKLRRVASGISLAAGAAVCVVIGWSLWRRNRRFP